MLVMTNAETIELELPRANRDEPSWRRYGIILFPRENRAFFPGYKQPFTFETNDGEVEAWVTAASSSDIMVGDANAGAYICSPRPSIRDSNKMSVTMWYRRHQELEPGDVLRIRHLNDRLYRLDIVTRNSQP